MYFFRTYDYDASGIRVSALHQVDTDANGTWDLATNTEYLVDHHNFTGYQQVIKETVYDENGNVIKTITYNFGHDEISQTVTQYDGSGNVTSEETHIFGHDGHGSVKVLYDAAAAIRQVYTYEAYGQMLAIHNAIAAAVSTGALTSLQYSGEQFDSRIGQQYLRARYYDPNSGRFNRLDPFAGNSQDPQSFHKYLYTHGNPIMGVDPTGLESLASLGVVGSTVSAIGSLSLPEVAILGGILTVGWFYASQIIADYATAGINNISDGAANIYDYVTHVLTRAKSVADTAARTLARSITRTMRHRRISVFPIFEDLWPDIYDFNLDYLSRHPVRHLLNYNPINENSNRAFVFKLYGLSPAPTDEQLDEYPYATTAQGGRFGPAEGEYVPRRQNSSQGGTLRWFYQGVLGRRVGAPFIVIPVPKLPTRR